jgi:hypothetical protein
VDECRQKYPELFPVAFEQGYPVVNPYETPDGRGANGKYEVPFDGLVYGFGKDQSYTPRFP